MIMEMLDHSPSDVESAIQLFDPARVKLERCTFQAGPQLDQNRVSVRSPKEPGSSEVSGAGIYFSQQPCDNDKSDDLQNLFQLATVACEVEAAIRQRQLVKKRRTPRNFWWISGTAYGGNEGSPASKKQKTKPARDVSVKRVPTLHSNSAYARTQPHGSTCLLKLDTMPSDTKLSFVRKQTSCIRLFKVSKSSSAHPKHPKPSTSKARVPRVPGQETRVQRFARRILQYVGEDSVAEKFIRATLGNNPDTSKALRLLLTQQKLKRLGDGGRGKAYLYVATPAGLRELEKLNNDTHDPESSALQTETDSQSIIGDRTL